MNLRWITDRILQKYSLVYVLYTVFRMTLYTVTYCHSERSVFSRTPVKSPESDPVGFSTFREIPMVGARSDPNVGIRCGSRHTSDDFRRPETIDSCGRILTTSDYRILTEPTEFYRNSIRMYTHWKQAG